MEENKGGTVRAVILIIVAILSVITLCASVAKLNSIKQDNNDKKLDTLKAEQMIGGKEIGEIEQSLIKASKLIYCQRSKGDREKAREILSDISDENVELLSLFDKCVSENVYSKRNVRLNSSGFSDRDSLKTTDHHIYVDLSVTDNGKDNTDVMIEYSINSEGEVYSFRCYITENELIYK